MVRKFSELPQLAAPSPSFSSTRAPAPLNIIPRDFALPHPKIFIEEANTTSNGLTVGNRIPGLKTSAAFLNSLRTNIHLSTAAADDPFFLSTSASPSLTNTPDCIRPTMSSSVGSLPPPSPFPLPISAGSDPMADVPELTTYSASSEDDKIAALKLIADSVAQQRQIASKTLIFHPIVVAGWVLILAIVAQLLYKGSSSDLALVATTWAGCVMAGLLLVRWITHGYLDMAEEVGTWKWLYKGGGDDEIIMTKFGDRIIGVLILHVSRGESSPTSRGNRSKKKNTANIRAWVVVTRYQRKGVGGGLLEEAVRICRERGCTPTFADDHANSGRILPAIFNNVFDRREVKARDMLGFIIEEQAGSKGRRPKR